MKTVLIITSGKTKDGVDSLERFGYVRDFCNAVESRLSNTKVCFTTYEDITVVVRSGTIAIYDTRTGNSLDDIDFVHFKNWINDVHVAGMIANYLKATDIAMYNSEVCMSSARTKIAQMVLLAQHSITVPDTFFASKHYLEDIFKTNVLPEGFSFPLIMKANDGAKGNDNHLIRDSDQALRILHNASARLEFVLQAYHENEGDYRFLYVGLDNEPMVFHRKAVGETHLNNTSQGGVGGLVSSEDVPVEYYELAHRAAEITGREIGGVDILVDAHTNIAYVLEVNQTPALATGYGIDVKIDKFAALVEQRIGDRP
jgi:glutathione synthase/RimK-type ligase-like ATP-grasp enzyme